MCSRAFLPIGFFGAIAYTPFKLDVAKAKALLAEAGYPDGFEVKLDVAERLAADRDRPVGAADHGPGRHQGVIVPAEPKQVIGQYRAPQRTRWR